MVSGGLEWEWLACGLTGWFAGWGMLVVVVHWVQWLLTSAVVVHWLLPLPARLLPPTSFLPGLAYLLMVGSGACSWWLLVGFLWLKKRNRGLGCGFAGLFAQVVLGYELEMGLAL